MTKLLKSLQKYSKLVAKKYFITERISSKIKKEGHD